MLLPEIKNRFDNVRKKIRTWFLVNGLARLLIFISLFSIGTFIIDWFVPDLPRGVRVSFLLIGIAVLGYVIFRYLIYPLKKSITDDDIAICVERLYPALKERLISSLQLSQDVALSDKFNSPELIRVLVNETNQIIQPLDFKQIINPHPVKKMLALMSGLILVMIIYTSLNPFYAGIWFNRILGGDARWPRKTMLQVIVKSDVIAKGQDVTIEVIAAKGPPERVYLTYEFESGGKGWERMTKIAHDKFKFDFPNVQSSFHFFARGGDDQTDWFSIKALTPPRLEQIQIGYEYPPYTKLSNTDPGQLEIGGVIRAPMGTTVNLAGIANIPLIFAQLLIGKKNAQLIKMNLENDVLGEPKKIKGQFVITGDSEYVITLKAQNGLENLEPVHYPIKAIVDTAPTIKIIEPNIDVKQVTPVATLPIKLVTTDDYGINRISLFHKISSRESSEIQSITFTGQYNSAPYGNSKIETNYNFEINDLKVKEGDIINYFMEAEDNCAISKTNITKTRELRLIIVSIAQLQKRIEETEMRIKDEVKKTLDYQQKVKDELGKDKELFAEKDKLTPAEQRSLQENLTNQRRVTQILERVTKEFDDIINDIVINKLWDATTRERLKSINELLKGVAGDKSLRAGELIARLNNFSNPTERGKIFDETMNMQQQIIQDLKNALAKMEEWEDYQEVVRIVRELLQKQTSIIEELKNKSK